MQATRRLLQQRQPMIKFLGKRIPPTEIDRSPQAHPASPTDAIPNSFAAYRQKAQQHGPLNTQFGNGRSIGHMSGASLGPIEPGSGIAFDKSELPAKFYHRIPWTQAEIEAIESGGATMVQ